MSVCDRGGICGLIGMGDEKVGEEGERECVWHCWVLKVKTGKTLDESSPFSCIVRFSNRIFLSVLRQGLRRASQKLRSYLADLPTHLRVCR